MKNAHALNKTEYCIYVYHKFHKEAFGTNRWQLLKKAGSRDQALAMAAHLHDSAAYQKIEVTCKWFDHKAKRFMAQSCKIYENPEKPSAGLLWGVAVLSAVPTLILSLFIING